MDEITIDDKTYISSKRAAAITGYAKDYVGQLCREGRVEARLIGRSWYVFEESIRKHRFDESKEGGEEPVTETEVSEITNNEAVWQEAVYTPEEVEMLPMIEHTSLVEEVEESTSIAPEPLQDEVVEESTEEEVPLHVIQEPANVRQLAIEADEEVEPPKESQNAWESWFEGAPVSVRQDNTRVEAHKEAQTVQVEVIQDIQPIQQHRSASVEISSSPVRKEPVIRHYAEKAQNYLVIKAITFAVILLFVSMAVIGSGVAEQLGNNDSWGILNFLGGASLIK